ncbi:MAG TPA: hypothetical protein VL123_08830 [Candidatus Udaeobacter sp.]|nr:hypothetical protein [Candidatus Udaeobacter sp.]
MPDAIASPLQAWESFYVIVASSAGALTGLQFVVLTLIAESGAARNRPDTLSAFGSPNVVHFCAVLLIGSILSAPWPSLPNVGVAITLCGILGMIYAGIVIRRTRRVFRISASRARGYQPVFEDWLWNTILPALAYSTVFVAGMLLRYRPAGALFALGAASLTLVFIGIHNAWDTVMYITTQSWKTGPPGGGASGAPPGAAAGARPKAPGSAPAGGPEDGRALRSARPDGPE